MIFEGLIPHAARPPSSGFVGPRYSFAVKMAKTPFKAVSHVLYEKFSQNADMIYQDLDEEQPDAQDFVDELERASRGSVKKLNATLEELLKRVEKEKARMKRLSLEAVMSQEDHR